MRNVLSVVARGSSEMVAATIRTILSQFYPDHVGEQFDVIATMLRRQAPKVETMLRDAKEELLAFAEFPPPAHWRQLWSTNPLERVNKEIEHRTNVAGIFPNPEALLRLAGAVLIEQHDEWAASDRRYFSETSVTLLKTKTNPNEGQVNPPELMTA